MIELNRCVREYTSNQIFEKYGDLGEDEIRQLRCFPCIFAYELGNNIDPKFGQIVDVTVRKSQKKVRVDYRIIQLESFLTAAQLGDMNFELDISDWEMGRTHWAVKDVNLPTELNRIGIKLPSWASPNQTVDLENHEFDVALSFPGTARKDLIEEIVKHLEKLLGPHRYFYDKNYQAQLARPSLDIFLQALYRNRSKLIVVFSGGDYQESKWCGIEFSAIKEIINSKEKSRIMYVRLDEGEVEGIFSTDGYIDIKQYNPARIAELIVERLKVL